jgi:H+/gluconate symporter-like permease
MGLAAGMNLSDVATAFQNGVGKILGGIGMIIGLGTLLGKLLAESGGARVVADTLIRSLGEKRLPWAMLLVAFTVGIPVWFSVGLVLLVPILFTVARQSRVPLLVLGIPLAAGTFGDARTGAAASGADGGHWRVEGGRGPDDFLLAVDRIADGDCRGTVLRALAGGPA